MEQPLFNETAKPAAAETDVPVHYPPKYNPPAEQQQVWLKSIISLAAYLLMGYYIFPSYKILLVITAVVMIHELGHFLAMKAYRYNDLGIFFIPLLGAYVSGTKREVSQKQSAVILLAGPLPGMLIGTAMLLIDRTNPGFFLLGIPYYKVAGFFILLNLINLLPVYPLDGGQLLNRVFLDEESIWSKVFVFLSIALLGWFAWSLYSYSKNPVFFLLMALPVTMLLRSFGDQKLDSVEKRIEEAGINADTEYEDLSDADYWKIRNILIENHPSFKDIPSAPPYEFCEKEDKIMATIQSLLHRHLIQDVSFAGKLMLFLLWVAGLAAPWLLGMELNFFSGQ